MFCPVAEPLHCKPWWAAKVGIENSCLVDLTNLVGFHGTSSSRGRDSMRKSVASGRTLAEHSQVGG